jgi:apoptosis-inducing factor 3
VPWKSTGIVVGAFPPGSLREVHLDGSPVLVVRVGERVHAIEAICPHAGGVLADGTLDGDRLTCPEHAAAYDVADGHVLSDPDGIEPPQGAVPALARYRTRITDDTIEIDVPDA